MGIRLFIGIVLGLCMFEKTYAQRNNLIRLPIDSCQIRILPQTRIIRSTIKLNLSRQSIHLPDIVVRDCSIVNPDSLCTLALGGFLEFSIFPFSIAHSQSLLNPEIILNDMSELEEGINFSSFGENTNTSIF